LRQQRQLDPHAGLLAVDRDHRPSHRLPVDHNGALLQVLASEDRDVADP
jgi:hypothetical protein